MYTCPFFPPFPVPISLSPFFLLQSGFLGLWAVGLLIALLGTGSRVTPEQRAAYETGLEHADSVPGYSSAQRDFFRSSAALRSEEVWFWYWREPYRHTVPPLRAEEAEAKRRYAKLAEERSKRLRSARSKLGIWSESGVGQVKETFWQAFGRGKLFAQRQTLWDVLFSTMRSRDDNM